MSARCLRCRDPLPHCICATLKAVHVKTRVEIVLHAREVKKSATTGPFALTALSNTRLHLQGLRDAPLDLSALSDEGRRVLVLYPSEEARTLTADLISEDRRPITLVVPDGTFRQAGRAVRRVPGLEKAQQVKLTGSHLSTFSALSRALGVIESPAVERELLDLFERSQRRREESASLARPAAATASSPLRTSPSQSSLPILFEDESLVSVNKPSGMLVHRGWAKDGAFALQILRDQIGQHLFPVHRLDRATSGALLFAKSPEMARDLVALFESETITKRYLALCRGHEFESLRLSHPLASEKGKPRRPAVTDLRLLGAFERYGLYEATPHTGRTHQIRRHLKHVSHPIIGDVRYGKGEHNRLFRERYGFARLALHCQALCFPHPRSGAQVSIHAPLPGDFATLLKKLELKLP